MAVSEEPEDARWSLFRDAAIVCASCGETHRGVFDLASTKPDFWQDGEDIRPNAAVAGSDHVLTEDFCILDGQHFFVRCVLELPLAGWNGQRFGFGVWSTLSRPNFERYRDTFDSGEQAELGPMFGWFSNNIHGYEPTLNLKCYVHPQNGRRRPLIELEPTEHRLSLDQRQGIGFDRLLEVYRAHKHDLAIRSP
ncbi:MAG: DUF2199 domain-containing protein [Beijerinckiaceae bacterium]